MESLKLITAAALNAARGAEQRSLEARLGGKGKNLAFLNNLFKTAQDQAVHHAMPTRVPVWVCVPPEAFESMRNHLPLEWKTKLDTLFQNEAAPQAIAEVSEGIQNWITSQPLEPALAAELENFSNQNLGGTLFAVRSSALGEDSGGNSFAGQFDTFLYVDNDSLTDAVRSCFASAFGPRVLAYLLNRKITPDCLRMSVIIQEMWDSVRSGIMFTCNPDGRLDELAIVAGYGLGEGIVSDRVESDFISVCRGSPNARKLPPQLDAKNTKIIIRKKTEQIVRDPFQSSGTAVVPVDAALGQVAVLSHEQIRTLCCIALQIEAAAGCPQDIEWGINAGGEIAILQTRPITTIPQGPFFLCDNSNVSESYPGISLPLTYDVVRGLYSEIFEAFIRSVGVKITAEQKHKIFDLLVVHVQGRIYYNLSNWYAMLQMVPGTAKFIGVWEEMLGIKKSEIKTIPLLKRIRTALGSMGTYAAIALRLVTLDFSMRSIHKHFSAISDEFWKIQLIQLTERELVSLLRDTTHRILRGWEVTLWNDAFTFSFAGVTKYLLKRVGVVHPAGLLNDLLGGDAPHEKLKIESAEAVASTARLAQRLGSDPALLAAVREFGLEALERPAFRSFSQSFRSHLAQYGDRTLDELKLETRTFRQQPEMLLSLLINYVENEAALPLHGDSSRYLRACDKLKKVIQSRSGAIGQLFWNALLGMVINRARKCMRHRENSRFDRSRAYGIARAITTAIGEKLWAQGILSEPTDVYLLKLEEIEKHLTNIQPITREAFEFRKKQYEQYSRSEPLGRFWIRGAQVEGNTIPQEVPPSSAKSLSASASVLSGTGSAPGLITASALVLDKPRFDCDVKGKILVTRMTDPGWVFLMVNCAGLISEKGSILSHTAIIGRELGIPTVVGVEHATKLIADGQLITVNGTTGAVQLHGQNPDSRTGTT